MKSRKAIRKRFKTTKSGKILRRPVSLNHYRAKKAGEKKRKTRKEIEISETEAKKIRRLLSSI